MLGDAVAAVLSWPARQSRGVKYLSDSTVLGSVSYTHLDVYKRQYINIGLLGRAERLLEVKLHVRKIDASMGLCFGRVIYLLNDIIILLYDILK